MKNKFKVTDALAASRSNATTPDPRRDRGVSGPSLFPVGKFSSPLQPSALMIRLHKRIAVYGSLKPVNRRLHLLYLKRHGLVGAAERFYREIEAIKLAVADLTHAVLLLSRGAGTNRVYHKKRIRPCPKPVNPRARVGAK